MSSTTREQILEQLTDLYLELAAVEAAYLSQRIAFFHPLPRGDQKKFFEGQLASVRLVLGDNRSGKSECGVVEAIAHSLGYRPWLDPNDPLYVVRLANGRPIPVPNVGRIVAQDYQQAIRQNIWPKFQRYAPSGWYKMRPDNRGIPIEITWRNGSKIHFMSDDQEDDAFEGTNGHWFWADEPIGYRKYTALRRGLVDFSGHCWLTLTPLTQPWIADVIESRAGDSDGEVLVFHLSIWDNCTEVGGHLSRKAIESFIADLRDDERAVRVGHQWMQFTGRVFKEWRPQEPFWINSYVVPDGWPRICVIDPHPRKPVAVLWAAIAPDNQIVVYRELFDESLVTIRDVAQKIKELEKGERIAIRLIDPSSQEQERTSGDTVHNRFAREGIKCALAKKRNVAAGLDAIHESLKIKGEWQEPGLVVFNTCPTVKKNFMRFVYDDWANSRQRDLKGEKQEVRKMDDDMIACIRYIFQLQPSYYRLRGMGKTREPKRDDDRGVSLVSFQRSRNGRYSYGPDVRSPKAAT